MIEILHGLSGSAFAKIVKTGDDNQTTAGLVQGKADVAEIGVRDVLQLRQSAGGPDPHHGTARVEPAVKHLHVCGGLRLLEGDVDGGKNAPRQRQQVGRKNHLLLRQARVVKNFRRMAVREEAIGLEILINLDKVEIAAGVFARTTGVNGKCAKRRFAPATELRKKLGEALRAIRFAKVEGGRPDGRVTQKNPRQFETGIAGDTD